MEAGRQIMLVAQKAAGKDEPKPDDMFEVGCVSSILQMLKLPDGTVKVLVEGIQRATHTIATTRALRLPRLPVPPEPTTKPGRGAAPRRRHAAVRPVRQAQQEDPAGDPHLHRRHRRRRAAWPTPSPRTCRSAREQAGGARPVRRHKRLEKAARAARARGRHPAGRKGASAGASSARWRRASASTT